ncbi:hypothetical protein Moror_4197 [Moniliophthora roreri MCA 2997]|uniref:Uncharacterized protein n=1 Tax=Moniliophthora roreri (strain MCA 2997) TaxID=1381753 RepID=V2WUX3_MONRO|nr:hypothetical protein Moror_4197 [Moniliophthora roreri MCA 2997]KAI3597444.1 hypothetical protein WG66_013198 [Moniliophthora roreri]
MSQSGTGYGSSIVQPARESFQGCWRSSVLETAELRSKMTWDSLDVAGLIFGAPTLNDPSTGNSITFLP